MIAGGGESETGSGERDRIVANRIPDIARAKAVFVAVPIANPNAEKKPTLAP